MTYGPLLLAVMPAKAVLVSTLLCCIIQIAHIRYAWGSEEELSFSEENSTILVEIELRDLFAGLLQDMNYTAKQNPVGCANDVRVITTLVPDGSNVLKATWSARDPCNVSMEYRVFFGQHMGPKIADINTTDTTMTFNNLKGCILHTIEVYALDSDSQIIGLGGHVKTFTGTLYPEITNLTLMATHSEISVNWSQIDLTCFPDVRYRVTTTGTNEIISQNHYTISGLACGTSYDVSVSSVDADGADYGVSAFATIQTESEEGTLEVTLTAPVAEALVAKWDPVVSVCQNITGYEVSLSEVGGTAEIVGTTEKTYFHLSGLKLSTAYRVTVQPLDGSGQAYFTAASAEQTTQSSTDNGRCPFPASELYYQARTKKVWCAVMDTLGPATLSDAETRCVNLPYPKKIFSGTLYRHVRGMFPDPATVMNNLRLRGYTEGALVSVLYSDGWKWGAMDVPRTYFPVDGSLLTGLPEGGNGPDDYTMMYFDPAKNFGLTAAKDGHVFEAVLCIIVIQ